MIRIVGDGSPAGTKVFLVEKDSETDISKHIKSITWGHVAGETPWVEISLAGHLTGVDLTGKTPGVDHVKVEALKDLLTEHKELSDDARVMTTEWIKPGDEYVDPRVGDITKW